MKGIKKACVLLVFAMVFMMGIQVFATTKDEDTIKHGVYIDDVDVSGMTYGEAEEAIKDIVEQKSNAAITIDVNGEKIQTTLSEIGCTWNSEIVLEEAVQIGKTGNVIKRYKDELDLENKGTKLSLDMVIDTDNVKSHLKDLCKPYNKEAKNASLKATGSGFEIIPEEDGMAVDYGTSTEELLKYITETWDGQSDIDFAVVTEVAKPKFTTEDCKKVSNTPMGSFYTNFTVGSSYSNRNNNIKNGTEKIDGHIVYPGEKFSCNAHLEPWTADNGWYPAGTYVDGAVADSLGGGICQVSSTLYNALLRAEIKITERYPHSMAVGYVDLAADAALAGTYKDLEFENDTDAPIYVQGIYESGRVTFNIYGHDTRADNRTVKYVSKTTGTTPIKENVTKDDTKPKDYREVTYNGQQGYTAELWKVVYVDGKEVEKTLLHTSRYAMSPRKVIKGTGKKVDDKKDDDKKDDDKDDSEKETKKTSGENETTKKSKNEKETTTKKQ